MAAVNLIGSNNYSLVALSVFIAVFASYAALDLASRWSVSLRRDPLVVSAGSNAALPFSELESGEKGIGIVLVIVHFREVMRRSAAGAAREKDGNNGPGEWAVRPTFYLYGAAVPAHDFRADPQPQTGPGISPGADKRLEERVSDVGVNAGSGISDGEANAGP
jgi:hypothetical protein